MNNFFVLNLNFGNGLLMSTYFTSILFSTSIELLRIRYKVSVGNNAYNGVSAFVLPCFIHSSKSYYHMSYTANLLKQKNNLKCFHVFLYI